MVGTVGRIEQQGKSVERDRWMEEDEVETVPYFLPRMDWIQVGPYLTTTRFIQRQQLGLPELLSLNRVVT